MKATGFTTDFEAGLALVRAQFENLKKEVQEAHMEIAEDIKEQSQVLVPKETTTLEQSAFVSMILGNDIDTFVVGYGGPNSPINPISGKPAEAYAIDVHEDTFAWHTNGMAKFLEIPTLEYSYNAEEILREKLNK